MNKSKFLKKSLAMLLALMLVLAMIPLSASAAAEDHIDVLLVNGKQVARNGDNLSVTVGTTTVSLDAVVKDGVDLYYVDSDKKQQLIDLENGTGDIELTDGYATDVENQYAMNIIAKVKENAATDDEETEYTYPLTITVDVAAASTANTLDSLADGNPVWVDMVDYTIDNVTRNVTVTLGFGKDEPARLTPDAFEPVEGASVSVTDNKNITVTSANGDTAKYTIKYVNEPGFLTFTVPDQVGETEIITKGKKDNKVNIDVSYDYTLTDVIPTFTTSDQILKVTVSGQPAPVVSDKTELDFTTPVYLVLWYGTGASDFGTVAVTLTKPSQNPEGVLNDITVATGSTAAESSAKTEITGSTTFVEMPASTDIAGDTYNVTVNFSKGATVTLTDAEGEKQFQDTANAGTYIFSGVKVIGEGHSFVIKVVSEDTKTTNTYTIQLGKPDAPAAELVNFVLKDLDTNKEYKAVWNGTTGTITMPYAYRADDALNNVALYFKASAGATVYFGKYTPAGAGTNYEMTEGQGETYATWSSRLPVIDTPVTYTVVGSDGTTTETYTITLKTEPAQTGRELTAAKMVGTKNDWEITDDNTYPVEIGKGTLNGNTVNTIEVTVPFSFPAGNNMLTSGWFTELTMSKGAVAYWAIPTQNGTINTIYDADPNYFHLNKYMDGKDENGVIDPDKNVAIYVLSEENAVLEGDAIDNIANYNEANKNATLYYLVAKRAPAETGSELLSIESTVDKNVTATLDGNTITIAVPNSYVSTDEFSLNLETSKLADTYVDNGAGKPDTSKPVVSDLGSAETDDRTMFRVSSGELEVKDANKQWKRITSSKTTKFHVVA